jgi:hypothetical protein
MEAMCAPEISNHIFLWNKSSVWLCNHSLETPGRWSHLEGEWGKASFSENPLWLVPSLWLGKMPLTTDGYEYRQPERICCTPSPGICTRLPHQAVETAVVCAPTCKCKALPTVSELREPVVRWFFALEATSITS